MKQVFLSQGKAIVKDVPQPLLDANSVLVEVAYSCISTGTERATLNATGQTIADRVIKQGQQHLSKILDSLQKNGVQQTFSIIKNKLEQVLAVGYSCSGSVIATGINVKNVKVGDLVACAGAGFASHGQFVAVPEQLVARLNNEASLKAASATTLGAIALHGLRRANLGLDDIVCVQGLGILGLLTVQLAVKSGYRVIGIDILEDRLQKARNFGAFCTINATSPAALSELNFATEHRGVDATIMTAAASSAQLLEFATKATRRKGKIVIVGDAPITVTRDELYMKEIDLLISCSYGPGRYDEQYEHDGIDYPYAYVRWTEQRNLATIARFIDEGSLNLEDLLTSEYPVQKAPEAYEKLSDSREIAILISYQTHADVVQPSETSTKKEKFAAPAVNFRKAKDSVHIAWVGTGGFSTTELIPTFVKHPLVKLQAMADARIQTVVNAAQQFNVENYSNDYRHLLADEMVDAFVVATPHKFHTEQLLDILGSGRAVFIEKPLCITPEQLQALSQFHAQNPHAPWHVDFNRRHAPLITQTKQALTHRASPLMITYRVNAGFIPANHWVQSAEHGGRIIGELCHFVHLLIYLVGALIARISVSPAGWGRNDMSQADTLAVHLSFSDGSVATLTYAANGNTTLTKERMEIFYEGKSITMEDYKVLQGFGFDATFNRMSHVQNKGYAECVDFFVSGLMTGELMAHVGERQRALYASEITLYIDQLARAGGGVLDLGTHAQKLASTHPEDHPVHTQTPETSTQA